MKKITALASPYLRSENSLRHPVIKVALHIDLVERLVKGQIVLAGRKQVFCRGTHVSGENVTNANNVKALLWETHERRIKPVNVALQQNCTTATAVYALSY